MAGENWYIREDAITDKDLDEFGHHDLAVQLKRKIVELGAPLTVALTGKHGVGKSSVGFLLRDLFKTDKRYVFVRIEAWRHNDESRRKAFLLDVSEELKSGAKGTHTEEFLRDVRSRLYQTEALQRTILDVEGIKNTVGRIFSKVSKPAAITGLITFVVIFALCLAIYFLTAG